VSYAEAIWAEALFCSPLQPSAKPGPAEVRAAVAERMDGAGIARCAACVAGAYGDDQTLAADRMTWCLAAVAAAFREPVPV
jgi:hypothetical protein